MMMIRATKEYEAGAPPSPELMAGMAKLTEEYVKSGNMVASGGLAPSSQGLRVRLANGGRTVTDGPFPETKELIGGFAILEAASREEAIAMVNRVLDVHAGARVEETEIEIRPLFYSALSRAAR
ncbi:MAG: YciI family protein [Burkholderiales bacterium]|nr:YciI family protein [Burkholderiales bacterium]